MCKYIHIHIYIYIYFFSYLFIFYLLLNFQIFLGSSLLLSCHNEHVVQIVIHTIIVFERYI